MAVTIVGSLSIATAGADEVRTVLIAALVEVARQRGVAVFEADVLAENPSMLRVFERTGLPMRKRSEGGIVHLELALAPSAPGPR